jgi:hypothetical protein
MFTKNISSNKSNNRVSTAVCPVPAAGFTGGLPLFKKNSNDRRTHVHSGSVANSFMTSEGGVQVVVLAGIQYLAGKRMKSCSDHYTPTNSNS